MENASKALIIAGSILISIIIISLGVVVFQRMSGSVSDNANLDQQERASFNAKITPYIGENISGSQVNALIQTARAINNKSINDGDNVKRIEIKNSSGYLLTKDNDNGTPKNVKTGTYYKVEGTFDNNGLITSITVTQNP